MTTLTLAYKNIKEKSDIFRLPKIHWKIVYAALIVLLASLFVFYIFLVNDLTKGVYLVKKDQKTIETLLDENKVLQSQLANIGFLGQTLIKAEAMNFEKTNNLTYIKISESSLARTNVK